MFDTSQEGIKYMNPSEIEWLQTVIQNYDSLQQNKYQISIKCIDHHSVESKDLQLPKNPKR